MAEIIVIMNQKGGVGKTTTAISLAAGFHYMGGRVLTIDIDPQGHLSKFSNCERSGRPTILELLNNKVTFKETVQHVSYGDTLSSSAALNEFQMILAAKASAPFVIRKLLEQIKDKYDYIIIDCPPAKNQLTVAALVAADKVIIPTEPEYFAADGVTLMLSDIIQDVKDNYNPNLKVEGFLIVKYKSRFKENLYIVELLETIAREIFNTKVFETKIRDTVAIPTSQREGKNIFEFDRNCNASQDYLRLIREMTAA